MNKERGRHYSDKGGHRLRRVFLSAQRDFRRAIGNSTISLKALFRTSLDRTPSETEWSRRRFMQRNPQDGRK